MAQQPWQVGAQPVYAKVDRRQSFLDSRIPVPEHLERFLGTGQWHNARKQQLKDWGVKRETELHRPPLWCMDQLCSGSGLFPPRLLMDEWFTEEELAMVGRLEALFKDTGHAQMLSRDIMALRIFDVDVRIIADDSGSMSWSMLRQANNMGYGGSGWNQARVQQVFGKRAFRPDSLGAFESCPFGPSATRWSLLSHALQAWESVFTILGLDRKLYLLNNVTGENQQSNLHRFLARGPGGGTPMGRTTQRVLQDYQRSSAEGRPLLLIAATDGEANDKDVFNRTLDQIQDGVYGDVQVLLLGLSLDPEDIEWFEDEECDDTRIRTIEAFEVEQQMILFRKVIQRPTAYTFDMHTFRALVTNFFPADYDYEAPMQTLRHRLYITLHAMDRRFTGNRDATYDGAATGGNCSGGAACASLSVGSLVLGGVHGLLPAFCFGGIAAYLISQSSGRSQRGNTNLEEGLSAQDDAKVGSLITFLQQRSLQQGCGYSGLLAITNGYGYSGGYAGGYGYRSRPQIDLNLLSQIQRAIGTLQPSERENRDLQFLNMENNNRALQVAVAILVKAATENRMM